MNIYFISGVLENDNPAIESMPVNQEIEAEDPKAAIDMFETIGQWEFDPETLVIWQVTEADRLEDKGQPSLFELPERQFKTTVLKLEDFERRARWRQYQAWCASSIDRFGIEGAKKMRPK